MDDLARKGLLRHKFLAICAISLLASLLVWGLWFLAPSLLTTWENTTYDARLRWRGPAQASEHLVIIGRDRESENRFGSSIWDRSKFARVITALETAGAALVVFDFHFGGVSPPERGGPASDAALINATKGAGMVVYPIPARVSPRGTATSAEEALTPEEVEIVRRSAPVLDQASARQLRPAHLLLDAVPGLLREARAVGHIAALSDEDGVYRWVPAYVNVGGTIVPALGLAVSATFLQVPPNRITIEPGRAVTLHQARFPGSTSGVDLRSISIPIDDEGRMLVNYVGRWEDGPFPYFSFVDVWDAIEEDRIDQLRAYVEGKIVLLLHASVGDTKQTPLETKAPGGFIHANVINTVLSGQSLRQISLAAQIVITLSLSVVAAWLLLTLSAWMGLGAAFGLALLYAAIAQGTFAQASLVLPVLVPLVSMGTTVAFAYLVGYVAEGRARRWVQYALGRYLGSTVADRISHDPTSLRLGGELREITVMFADLSGFTRMSTQVPPDVLTQVTNRYLGYIVEQIEATGGYVVQFIGDCVVAIWGAPHPDESHAIHAVRAAMAVVERVNREKKAAEAKGDWGFSVKIGLNSGPAIIGNIGSERRYNYTAMGETVNLASRLEGATSQYACPILVGGVTAKQIADTFLLCELDTVQVKGMESAVSIFEPLAELQEATEDHMECARRYQEGLAHYRAQHFQQAAVTWEALAATEPLMRNHQGSSFRDTPSSRMAARARSLDSSPPDESWAGTWVLSSK